jgi:hypothetical protein
MRDSSLLSKGIGDEDVPVLYECLQQVGPVERLDLVLHTQGGRVNVSRKICLLLRSFAAQVNVLVPYKARSAGTLLCLGADQIVMGALAELGPIDPQMATTSDAQVDGPRQISAEDVRCFKQMAEAWFGLRNSEQQILNLLCERIFPTSLSSFFRSDQQMRQIAAELLQYQLPDADGGARQRIVDQLISGYHAHDYVISRLEAEQLGLRVRATSPQEEPLIWNIWRACDRYLAAPSTSPEESGVRASSTALIASANFTAVHATRMTEYVPPAGPHAIPTGQPLRFMAEAGWRVL